MLNKVHLIGNLGSDPELKKFDNGSIANVSLATSEKWKTKDGEQKTNTEWHRLVFNNKAAEIVEKYCKKGDKIYAEGRIKYRKYEKDGETKYLTEIRVTDFKFLTTKGEGQGGQAPPPPGQFEAQDDDLPF